MILMRMDYICDHCKKMVSTCELTSITEEYDIGVPDGWVNIFLNEDTCGGICEDVCPECFEKEKENLVKMYEPNWYKEKK